MATEQSPRIKNGVVYWYEGDIFYLPFEIIDDETKAPFMLGEDDYFEVEFYKNNRLIKLFKMDKVENGLYHCYIDERTTALFTKGEYEYKIQYVRNNRETAQTIENCGKCVVEGTCKCLR